jgi:hypothetical protein
MILNLLGNRQYFPLSKVRFPKGVGSSGEPDGARRSLVELRLQMLKRLIFWEYARGSWQYDVIVAGILAFLFLTPRGLFRDQPRISHVSIISVARGEFMVDPEFWDGTPENLRTDKLTREIRLRSGNSHLTVIDVQPVPDSDGEVRYFIAYTKP